MAAWLSTNIQMVFVSRPLAVHLLAYCSELLRRVIARLHRMRGVTLAPPVAEASEGVFYGFEGTTAPCTLRGGEGNPCPNFEFGLTALSLVHTLCWRDLAW